MKTAIVILNWNGRQLLEKFIPSVVQYSGDASGIYVVDNASTDDSTGYLKKHFPQIHIIQHTENYAYAGGYNRALEQIDADIFCLLNSDVEVTENWLKPVISHFEHHPQTAIVQPKILDYKRKQYFEYAGAAGGFIDALGYPFCRGRIFDHIEQDLGQYDEDSPVFWASGACFFIRKETFFTLGAFDEQYEAHQEEIDLCWRAFNRGLTTYYVHSSSVYHVGGASLSHTHPKKTFLNFRNSLFNLLKNAPSPLPKILLRLILDGIAGVKFLFEGKPAHTWAIVRAHFSFYAHFFSMYGKRKGKKRRDYASCFSIVYRYYIAKKISFPEKKQGTQ